MAKHLDELHGESPELPGLVYNPTLGLLGTTAARWPAVGNPGVALRHSLGMGVERCQPLPLGPLAWVEPVLLVWDKRKVYSPGVV
jgi:hypothetical protein